MGKNIILCYLIISPLTIINNKDVIKLIKIFFSYIEKESKKYTINKSSCVSVIFIILSIINFVGIIPIWPRFTRQSYITLCLVIVCYFIVIIFKWTSNLFALINTNSFKNRLIIIRVKILTYFVQILTLGLRLSINLTVGHIVIHVYSFSITFIVIIVFYEIFACIIQAYVFNILLNVYLDLIFSVLAHISFKDKEKN